MTYGLRTADGLWLVLGDGYPQWSFTSNPADAYAWRTHDEALEYEVARIDRIRAQWPDAVLTVEEVPG